MENYNLETVDSFDDFTIKTYLLRGIYSISHFAPSLQFEKVMDSKGHQVIDEEIQDIQAIILAPTQDLAMQLLNVMKALAEFLNVSIHLCKKTTSPNDCEGFQILIGTPENILNLLKIGGIKRNTLKMIVLDEADELIGGSYKEQINEILSGEMDENTQVTMFSTTMPDDVLPLAKKYTRNPVMILIPREELMLDRITQFYVLIDEKEKKKSEALAEMMKNLHFSQMIIYCNAKETVNQVGEALSKSGIDCSRIDETKEFSDRDKILKRFRTGEARTLVATSILARGIDINQVSVVVNYDLPLSKEEYLHRIGRCNRFSKRGYAITLITAKEAQELEELEKYYCTKFLLLKDFEDFY